jgi:putative phosphoribosyl transferase
MKTSFRNREDAGKQLAHRLTLELKGTPNMIVLGLPRGGVPVAAMVAQALNAPLDVVLVRKLGLPHDPECAMGAVAEPDIVELDDDLIQRAHVTPAILQAAIRKARDELEHRRRLYRNHRPAPDLHKKTVVLVDDGLATGYTLRAAIASVKSQHPDAMIVAIPVGSHAACTALRPLVDELVCLHELTSFQSVGAWYQEFSQTTDETVRSLLETRP